MKKCPVCDLELAPAKYEGHIVRRCGSQERKAIFKANLANLPETKHPIEEVLGEAAEALDGFLQALIAAPF